MISTDILKEKVTEYTESCHKNHKRPTYKGLSRALNISGQTISNVIRETYNNKPYTKHPHITRCIDNKDFELIQELFKVDSTQ